MTRRETLRVAGMSCSGCERNVERALRRISGVQAATANKKEVTVRVVAADAVDDDALADAVHRAGYHVLGQYPTREK